MQWLVPSVIATMTGTVILTVIYFYLYAQDKKIYLKIWAISWGIYFTRYLFLLAMLLWQKNNWLLIGNQLSTLISGTLLLYGTYLFVDKKFTKSIFYMSTICAVWIFISVLNNFPFMVLSLPTFSFLAFIYIWTGYVFYKYSKSAQKEASIVGGSFIAWGVHKANYPFLQPVAWFAPWGYLIAAMLEFITALGLIIVYFRKTKDESEVAEKKYKDLFSSIRDAIIVTDIERTVIECNPAFTDLFGYTTNEIKGKKTKCLYENEEQFYQLGQSLRKYYGKKSFLKTVNYRKKNGQIFPGETGVYYLKNIQSEIVGFIGLIRDISERKKTEEKLERQHYYLEKAQELGQLGTWELDLLNNRLVWTDENCRIFGVPEGSVVDYETFLSKVHPDDRAYVDREWKAAIEGKPYDIVHRILLDGRVRWVREKADLERDNNGKLVGAIGFTQDITERIKAEIELRRIKLAIDQTIDAIGIATEEGQHFYQNATFTKMFGYELNEIAAMHPRKLYRDQEVADEVFETIMRGDNWTGQTTMVSKNGRHIPIELRANSIKDENDRVVGLVGIHLDITDRLKLERSLQQAQKMESIGTLAGGIAHDFNNILSSVLGFTELALESIDQESPIKEDLQEVYSAGLRAKELVYQILTYARQSEEKMKPVKVASIINEALKFIRSSTPASIDIKKYIESDSFIMGNATQLHQIMMNLCTNAAHAMEDNSGTLEVVLKDTILDKDSGVGSLKQGRYIEITVSDTGIGIEPHVIDRVFEPYFTTKSPGEGTGMGLALVHGIVDSFDGKIFVESKYGEGAVFTIYFPICKSNKTNPVKDLGALPTGQERILFIDDEVSITKFGSRVLGQLGYSVTSMNNSIEALELFKNNPNNFDLVISDVTMPEMTGDDLAKEIMQTRTDIPVILSTGYSKKLSEDKVLEIGVKAITAKPLVTADLAKIVRKVLDQVKS